MSDSRKIWTKSRALTLLGMMAPVLKELEKLGDGAGQMPSPLRKKISTFNGRTRDLIKEIESWVITNTDKAIIEVYQQKNGAGTAPKSRPVKKPAKKPVTSKTPRSPTKKAKKNIQKNIPPTKKQLPLFDQPGKRPGKSGDPRKRTGKGVR